MRGSVNHPALTDEDRRIFCHALVSAMHEVGEGASDREIIFRLLRTCVSIFARVAPASRGHVLMNPWMAFADGTLDRMCDAAAEGSDLRKRLATFDGIDVATVPEVRRAATVLAALRRAAAGRADTRERNWHTLVSFALEEKSKSRRGRLGERSFEFGGRRVGDDKPLSYAASYKRRDRTIAEIVATHRTAFDESRRLAFST